MKTSNKILLAKIISKLLILFKRKSNVKVIRNDLKWSLDLNEAIDLSIYLLGKFEPVILNIFLNNYKLYKDKFDIIDIGSNCGAHTLYFAKEFPNSKIISIEPTQYSYLKLNKNISLNPSLKKNIISLQAFVTSKKQLPKSVYSSWNFNTHDEKHNFHLGIKKSTKGSKFISLDELTSKFNIKNSIIKCDVDGNELNVFKSGIKYLKKFKPIIVMELAPYLYKENGYTSEDLFILLKNLNYNFYEGISSKKILNINEYSSKISPGSSKNILLK